MILSAILFDLDGTLLDRRATFRRHLELQVGRHPHLFRDGDAEAYVAELLRLDENGAVDRNDFYRRAEARLGLPTGAAAALRSDFKTHFPESCVPFRDVWLALASLKTSGLRLGVITNGSIRTQTRKIDGLGIPPLLDSIVISQALGWHKPDRRIFEAALAEMEVPASEAVFVGDNPAVDVTGAKQAGLFAVWKRDDFWQKPPNADLIIDEVCELPDRLEMIRATQGKSA